MDCKHQWNGCVCEKCGETAHKWEAVLFDENDVEIMPYRLQVDSIPAGKSHQERHYKSRCRVCGLLTDYHTPESFERGRDNPSGYDGWGWDDED